MIIAEFKYELKPVSKGYTNRTLYINLSDNRIEEKPVDQKVKDTFFGGKGFDLWLMWNSLPKDRVVKWNDPENEIAISSGPLGGTSIYPGSGKSIVTTISPLTGSMMDSNVGGYFGPLLKFAGFDALEVQGKADEDVVIFIDGIEGKVTIEKAGNLPKEANPLTDALVDRFKPESGKKRWVSAVTAGTAAEHALMGCLNFSWFDKGRGINRIKQAGRGGTGTVFRDKKVLGIVARVEKVNLQSNDPADVPGLRKVGKAHSSEIRELDPKQNEMAVLGTTHLVTIMNDYDLLPTLNFQYGSHKEAPKIGGEAYRKLFDPGFDGCWIGCSVACAHGVKDFKPKTGPMKGKPVFVDGPEYETIAGCGSSWGVFDPLLVIEVNYYCDAYGVDTISVGTGIAFLMECFQRGLLTKEKTGGFEIHFGDGIKALELLHEMARGEGWGKILGQGIRNMKKLFAEKYGADSQWLQDIGMEAKGLEYSEYVTKESLAQQGGYGLALKGPQHDEAWLIFLDMVHNFMPTFEQKAEALHWFPMWRTWFALNGLCKLPWNDIVPEDNKDTFEPAKVIKHVQWYNEYFTAVTGKPMDPEGLIKMSEKVYNFQRIWNLRQGFGRRKHDDIPYRSVGPVSVEEYESRQDRYDKQLKEQVNVDPTGMNTEEKLKKTREYREDRYEKLKDAVYQRRGWTNDGVPTVDKAKELCIDWVPNLMELIKKHQ